MLVGTDPGEPRDDCCVVDEGASLDGRANGACCGREGRPSEGRAKRASTPDGSGGLVHQRQRCDDACQDEGAKDACGMDFVAATGLNPGGGRGGSCGVVFVHCHFGTGDGFEWGETLVDDEPSEFHEELSSLIAAVPQSCGELYVWRGSHWGRQVPVLDLAGAKDVWCSIASTHGFVPKLEQFAADADESVVGKLCAMVQEWKGSGMMKWRPLRGATYSWENLRAWRGDALRTAADSRDNAILYPVPSWMDSPIDWEVEVPRA